MADKEEDRRWAFESFECGEVPSALEMKRARRLEQWQLIVQPYEKTWILRAEGVVYGGPNSDNDGDLVRTGALMWVDRRYRFVRSHSTLYVLGEHAGDAIPVDGIEV